ncbi:hypothetical protein PSN45_001934 [Yamadazyma tenuis]|nr:hypothetical protein PSN45_001934 [Yamadazyma tenuis]
MGYNHTVEFNYNYKHIEGLIASDLSGSYLTKVTFHNDNALTYDFLHEVNNKIINLIESSSGSVTILSPILDWKLDISSRFSNDYLVTKVNYNSNYHLNLVYLDGIEFVNYMIIGADTLNVYLIHDSRLIIDSQWVQYSIDNPVRIKDFLKYYLLINGYGYGVYFTLGLRFWIIVFTIYFLTYLYLSISNLHKIKSNFGILCGWFMEVNVSVTAAVQLVKIFNGCDFWEDLFQSPSFVTIASALFIVVFISSRNLIRLIIDLSSCDDYCNMDSRYLQTRLYKFFIGLENNTEASYQKLDMLNSLLRNLHLESKFNLILPRITKILSLDILTLKAVEYSSLLFMRYYFGGAFLDSLNSKIGALFAVIFWSLIIDHILQLTYLIGLIIVDNYRTDITKILDNGQSNTELNSFSSLLLKGKPPRNSILYKLGTTLTFVRYPTTLKSWLMVLPPLEVWNLFMVLTYWALYIPYSLFHDSNILSQKSTRRLSFDIFYFLEYCAFTVLLMSVSVIVFRLSTFKIVGTDSKIELNDNKSFKSIDLPETHYLDVIKLKSNNSSFLISIGLDHKVFVWSPLSLSKPIDICSTIGLDDKELEFWPINYANISTGGEFIILMNFKYKLIRCYSRSLLKFHWTSSLEIDFTKDKILESFFRERTAPAFLQLKKMKKPRRDSIISMNGNYPRLEKSSVQYDFVMVLESGSILTASCESGTIKVTSDILDSLYDTEDIPVKLKLAKKIITPRVNDRIVHQLTNGDLVVSVAVNNKWKFLKLDTSDNKYNKQVVSMDTPMSRNSSSIGPMAYNNYNFESINVNNKASAPEALKDSFNSLVEINKTIIVTLDFVGMIIRVNNLVAELIDVQTGIILHKINVAHFKPSSFKVSHSEPTHCRFCGCASISSLTVVYEDFSSDTLIIHTFKVANRSKTNICLRVERDPREIRCAGFDDVYEEQYWYEEIGAWQLTDINMVIGVKNSSEKSVSYQDGNDDIFESGYLKKVDMRGGSKLRSLKSKIKTPKENEVQTNNWTGFIITLGDGKMVEYEIPRLSKGLVCNNIGCIEKFGYKSVAVSFGNLIKILYLGNDKLVEENLYFNDLNKSKAINNELLFINKRRKR